MKKHQLFYMIMALIVGIGALSACSNNQEPELDYVDVSDLPNMSKPEIPPIIFNDTNDNETSRPTSKDESTSNLDSVSTSSNNNSTDNDNSSVAGSAGTSSSNNSTANDNSSIVAESSGNPTTNDNPSTNVEVDVPVSSDYYTAITEIVEFDPQKVKRVIFGNADVTDNTLNYPDSSPIYIWEYEDKELCISNDDALLEYTSDLSTSINIIFSPPKNNYKGNADLFTHSGDNLNFCTRDEAVKAVRNILSDIGISVSEKADVYALCQSDLQTVVDAECAKGDFYQFDEEWQRIPVTSYTVQKNQECYYIVFNADWNGIPIYNNALYYKTIKDLAIFHPTITAIYSADGLIELRVSEYRSIIKQGEKISQLISPESAAQVVGEKYKDVVGIEKISFDKMSLMYVLTPISENGKINLNKTNMTPAWVCTVKMTEYKYDRETGTQAPVISQTNVLIDAQTGLEII